MFALLILSLVGCNPRQLAGGEPGNLNPRRQGPTAEDAAAAKAERDRVKARMIGPLYVSSETTCWVLDNGPGQPQSLACHPSREVR